MPQGWAVVGRKIEVAFSFLSWLLFFKAETHWKDYMNLFLETSEDLVLLKESLE